MKIKEDKAYKYNAVLNCVQLAVTSYFLLMFGVKMEETKFLKLACDHYKAPSVMASEKG